MKWDWTTAQVLDFVADGVVIARDKDGENASLPHWLSVAVEEVWLEDFATQMTPVHPKDRAGVTNLWLQSLRSPGESMEIWCRSRRDGDWRQNRVRIVNLLDHPDVRAVLFRIDQQDLIDNVDDAEEDLSESHESPPWVMLHLGLDTEATRVDGDVDYMFGRPVEAVVGRPFIKFLHPDSLGIAIAMWVDILDHPGAVRTITAQFLRPDDSTIWIEATVMNQLDQEARSVVILAHDVTGRRAKEAELLASREQSARLAAESARLAEKFEQAAEELRLMAEEVPSAMFRLDASGHLSFGNARWVEMVGSGPIDELSDFAHPDNRIEIEAAVAELGSPSGPDNRTLEVLSANGERVFSVTCRALGEAGGDRRAILGAVHDVTAAAEFRHHAEFDVLTGVLNRHALDRRLELALSGDSAGILVAFIDLDGFKLVNDQHGHDAGDTVLVEVAERLRNAIRPSDDIGRYGGDEFVIICHDAAPGAEAEIWDRIESRLSEPIVIAGGSWAPAASVGMARSLPGDDGPAVLRRADRSMYETKRAHHAAIGADSAAAPSS